MPGGGEVGGVGVCSFVSGGAGRGAVVGGTGAGTGAIGGSGLVIDRQGGHADGGVGVLFGAKFCRVAFEGGAEGWSCGEEQVGGDVGA